MDAAPIIRSTGSTPSLEDDDDFFNVKKKDITWRGNPFVNAYEFMLSRSPCKALYMHYKTGPEREVVYLDVQRCGVKPLINAPGLPPANVMQITIVYAELPPSMRGKNYLREFVAFLLAHTEAEAVVLASLSNHRLAESCARDPQWKLQTPNWTPGRSEALTQALRPSFAMFRSV